MTLTYKPLRLEGLPLRQPYFLKWGMNMICSYCGSENNPYAQLCDFCQAPLNLNRPKLREYLALEQTKLPFGELSLFHTYDLLILLRLVREERTKTYHLMRTLQKGAELIEIGSDDLTFAESEYRRYTARMKVIEGILIDRMGYKPKRIDDKLLEALRKKIENQKF